MLPALLERQASVHGTKTLVRADGRELSYAEVVREAALWAGRLDVEPGDRVAAICESRLELLLLWLGCLWRGATLAPVDPALRGAQLDHVVESLQATLVLQSHNLLELAAEPASPVAAVRSEPGDTAAILFTSGTTGPAKGVLCPHEQWHHWAVNTGAHLELTGDDVLATTLPLFHTNALNTFWQAVVHGATYALLPRFSVSRFWDWMRDSEATVTYLLGAMVGMLKTGEDDRNHRVRIALAPGTPPDLAREFERRFGVRLLEAYGSTETNYVIGARWSEQRSGWMGRVVDGFEARVEESGELLLRSREPLAFATAYLDAPLLEDGWFRTGDRVVEGDGWFRFADRLKDAIRRRGENISAWEVEQVLLAHPGVEAAAVVGVPAELGEEEVLAAVVGEVDPAELVRFCEPRIARYAIPRYVEVVDALPQTPNGKVAKHVLRERGVTAATWDREA